MQSIDVCSVQGISSRFRQTQSYTYLALPALFVFSSLDGFRFLRGSLDSNEDCTRLRPFLLTPIFSQFVR